MAHDLNTYKGCVQNRYPRAACRFDERTRQYLVGEYDPKIGWINGMIMGSAGSAKAAWHDAYAKIVSR